MKLHFLPIALAFAFTGIQANAQSQRFEHKLVFVLDVVYPGTSTSTPVNGNGLYNYESKKLTQKVTNKVLLERLLTELSDEMGDTIQGWSISLLLDSNANGSGVVLTKKGEDSIDITEYIKLGLYDSYQTARKGTSNVAGTEYKETGEWFGIGEIELNFFTLYGTSEGGSSVKYSYDTETNVSAVSNFDVSGFIGGVTRNDTAGFLRGSVKGAKGTPFVQ